MGTGIGKDCKICGEQLTYDKGFDINEEICNSCKELIPKVLNYLARRTDVHDY